MFEILMLIGFAYAGFCQLAPLAPMQRAAPKEERPAPLAPADNARHKSVACRQDG